MHFNGYFPPSAFEAASQHPELSFRLERLSTAGQNIMKAVTLKPGKLNNLFLDFIIPWPRDVRAYKMHSWRRERWVICENHSKYPNILSTEKWRTGNCGN